MFKYVILCWFVSLCVPCSCDYNYPEGADCKGLDGVRGSCVNEKRCGSALANQNVRLARCLKVEEGKTVVCCSDCELVDDTRADFKLSRKVSLNVKILISPTGKYFKKTGNKARDSCLQYIKELPYKCHDLFTVVIDIELNKESKRCHNTFFDTVKNNLTDIKLKEIESRAEYPHQALLGYGDTKETADWLAGGSIISDRYILTASHINSSPKERGKLNFVALGVLNYSDPSAWQVHKVKRFINHPSYYYGYQDIALIETETQIKFTYNVLPACLHLEDVEVTDAVATTWWDLKKEGLVFADTIQTIRDVEPFPEEICNSTYYYQRGYISTFKNRYQMCFGSKKNPSDSCRGLSGEPLLINNQISSCVYTVVGVTSFGAISCGPTDEDLAPEVYTRVSYHVPWIESIVWP